jgi:hypothetical protein
MEDVLDVSERPDDPPCPPVCMDETSKQLVGETRTPLPAQPGRPVRIDYEYVRQGVCNLFLWVEPLTGRRHIAVTERRTKQDWARFIRDLLTVHYPEADRVILGLDHLNTHMAGALDDTFPPAEARRLLQRLALHYTPVHGSWLNLAEIECSVLARQCLDRRIPDAQRLAAEITAWAARRNTHQPPIAWRFTTADARIKLRHLDPSL